MRVSNKHGEPLIDPYISERNAAETHWARVAKYGHDAGIATERVNIEQAKLELIATTVRGVFAALGLDAETQRRGAVLLAERFRALGPGV